MKQLSFFLLALVLLLNFACMKKRRIGTGGPGLQATFLNPSEQDSVCPGGVNVFIRPLQAENSILVGQRTKFELLASGCLSGYGVSVNGRFLPFNPGIQVDVTMPQTPEPSRVEEFSIVAFNSSGAVHRGPYQFDSIPFNVSAGSPVNLNFFPSQTISVEGNSAKFFMSASQQISVQRVFSDEAGYIITQTPTPFTLAAGEWREFNLQLSRGAGGSSGVVKVDYLANGVTQTAQLTVNHNVCMTSYEDDFMGYGRTQALTYQCADGLIRLPLNLTEQLVSSWPLPSGHSLRDVMHGRIDADNKADLLFFTTRSSEPRKGYFFYGKSKPSSTAQTSGGSFNVVPCTGAWEAPVSTSLPNQFVLEPASGSVSAKIYTVQNGGVRYESLLSVGDDTCSLGSVQLAPASTSVSVSQAEVNPGENFTVTWSASNVTGYRCRLQKKLERESAWNLVGSDNLPGSGSMVLERREAQSINASTQYRAFCSKTENGTTMSVGEDRVQTVEVKACQMQAAGATSRDLTVDSKRYRVLTFSQVGNHSLSVSGNCNVTSILVAGGGGGGGVLGRKGAGGGGAGGLIYFANSSFFQSGTYNVSVGSGGAVGANGQNSSIVLQADRSKNITASGGGRGGNGEGHGGNQAGASGGSGGGGGFKHAISGGGGMSGQGFGGGTASGGNYVAGGGGGGAGGRGGDTVRNPRGGYQTGGPGGPGRLINIAGSSRHYAGGGAGHGQHGQNSGGVGGGGGTGAGGQAGTGGGGGANAAGGSGVVIIRYELP